MPKLSITKDDKQKKGCWTGSLHVSHDQKFKKEEWRRLCIGKKIGSLLDCELFSKEAAGVQLPELLRYNAKITLITGSQWRSQHQKALRGIDSDIFPPLHSYIFMMNFTPVKTIMVVQETHGAHL